MFADIIRCLIADGVGQKEILWKFIHCNLLVVSRECLWLPIIGGTGNDAKKAIKSALTGPTVFGTVCICMPRNMPFAAHIGRISHGLEYFGNGYALKVQIAPIPFVFPVIHHVSHTGLMGVQSREQRCPRRAAPRCVVKLGESQPIGSK